MRPLDRVVPCCGCRAAALVLMVGCAVPAWGQATAATISGRVVDSALGLGIAGAEVRLRDARTVTDAAGNFQLYTRGAAGDTLRVRRLGFSAASLMLPADTASSLRFLLRALPQLLSPTVVKATRTRYTGRLAGYHERLERQTTGQFITRAELEQDQQGLLSHVLQHSPNIQVRRGRGVPVVSMRGRECRPMVWLDGSPLTAGTVDLDAFPTSSLHGVELYLGSVSTPQRYQGMAGKSECGTILLWSRGPDTDPVGAGSGASAGDLERLLATTGVYTAEQVAVAAEAESGAVVVVYPPSLRAARVTGSVIAEFVVDTNGLVDASTIGFATSTHRAFSEAVRVALVNTAFRAARRDGAPVRQLVRQRFTFDR